MTVLDIKTRAKPGPEVPVSHAFCPSTTLFNFLAASLRRVSYLLTITNMLNTNISFISNYIKPHRAEAIARIRTNTFFLVLLAVATHLLPVPSLLRAFRAVSSSSDGYDGTYGYLCLLGASSQSFGSPLTVEKEVALSSVLVYNILQSVYAIKYPRQIPPLPASSAKAKRKTIQASPTPARRLSQLVTPKKTSDPSFVPSSSVPHPTASPLRYTLPGSSTNTFASTGSLPPSPSPVVSAYRGKQLMSSVGRPVDGAFISRLMSENDDDT
ncbi:hypothetical protein DFS33DRAFT_1383370 [Desarmillaria ectypa]|nr:hypothetical protein DFS33DRAFT_1383370 [Desarmillaria ectypa]